MTRDYLLGLLDFHYWARDRLLSAVEALTPAQYAEERGSSFPSVRETLLHAYFAEWIWFRRLHGDSPASRPSVALPDVNALRLAWTQTERGWRAYLRSRSPESLAETIRYKLFSGEPGTSAVWQIVAHVVNHGSYHRGQVATLLRQLGATPPKGTDLIVYYREHAA